MKGRIKREENEGLFIDKFKAYVAMEALKDFTNHGFRHATSMCAFG